ncbi:OLC1v1032086C1 [Oldenlandia corymbosa var. corymbosa]|uniref:OLC1v1032086C1 n=1 Tax=Oldenlandia corymbosa var. corymbosa TaxID=529605 RepID=A0AAV1CMV4_OLDCO|nr:OLC1v1032086C1 [Oldenlandia corymbosa var. corymbosa]
MMMSFALSSHLTKAPLLPFHHHQSRNNTSIFCGVSRPTTSHLSKLKAQDDNVISEPSKKSGTTISNLAILGSTLLVTVSEPASAVTGVNYFDDGLIWTLAQLAISAFVYFLVSKMVPKGFRRDVPSVHVCVHVLPRVAALGTILELQKISEGSINEVSLV